MKKITTGEPETTDTEPTGLEPEEKEGESMPNEMEPETNDNTRVRGWNGLPFPENAERLVLPDGRILEDAIVWPDFCQEELDLDPDPLWAELLALPTWPSDREIPFREEGDDPHWITGSHRALNLRGNELKRDKIWCQSDYGSGLRRYGYIGWQHRISPATHAVEFVPPVQRMAERLNAGLVRSGDLAHNHWIVTRYEDASYNIGFHSDKDADFAPDSYFIVIKFGAARNFAFRLSDQSRPFFVRALAAGTAIFVRCKAPGAANDLVQHGVPPMRAPVGPSGSIVSRCITTVFPWAQVKRAVQTRSHRVKAKVSVTSLTGAEMCREHFRRLYHWFLDEADRVHGGTDAGLRRRARGILLPELNSGLGGGQETGNFFDWVAAHRTGRRTAGTVEAPPEGYDDLVQALRSLLL